MTVYSIEFNKYFLKHQKNIIETYDNAWWE